jgi:hypothetical protein
MGDAEAPFVLRSGGIADSDSCGVTPRTVGHRTGALGVYGSRVTCTDRPGTTGQRRPSPVPT